MAEISFTLRSSFISGGTYDDETQELTLDLTGGTYSFPNVPPELVEGLRTAHSAGKFYHQFIKPYGG